MFYSLVHWMYEKQYQAKLGLYSNLAFNRTDSFSQGSLVTVDDCDKHPLMGH